MGGMINFRGTPSATVFSFISFVSLDQIFLVASKAVLNNSNHFSLPNDIATARLRTKKKRLCSFIMLV